MKNCMKGAEKTTWTIQDNFKTMSCTSWVEWVVFKRQGVWKYPDGVSGLCFSLFPVLFSLLAVIQAVTQLWDNAKSFNSIHSHRAHLLVHCLNTSLHLIIICIDSEVLCVLTSKYKMSKSQAAEVFPVATRWYNVCMQRVCTRWAAQRSD